MYNHKDQLKQSYLRYRNIANTVTYPFEADKNFYYCFCCLTWWGQKGMCKARSHFKNGKCDINECRNRLFELIEVPVPTAPVYKAFTTEKENVKIYSGKATANHSLSSSEPTNVSDKEYVRLKCDNDKHIAEVKVLKNKVGTLEAKLRLEEKRHFNKISVLEERLKYLLSVMPGSHYTEAIDCMARIKPIQDDVEIEQRLQEEYDYWRFPDKRPPLLDEDEPAKRPVIPPTPYLPPEADPKPIQNSEPAESNPILTPSPKKAQRLTAEECEALIEAADNKCTISNPCRCGETLDGYDTFTCYTCKQKLHANNDWSDCCSWPCNDCDTLVCIDCNVKNGGNKARVYCSQAKCQALRKERLAES